MMDEPVAAANDAARGPDDLAPRGSSSRVTRRAGLGRVPAMSSRGTSSRLRSGKLPVGVRLAALALLMTGCFESGRLGEGALTGDTAVPPDATDTATATDTTDTSPPTDTADTGDTATAPPDSADTVDASDTIDTADTTVAADTSDARDADTTTDTGPLRACLTQGDCAGLVGEDRCAGPIACIDYGCRPDPSRAVVCPGPTACEASTCNPSTGLCDTRNTCSCETHGALACGVLTSWSSNDPGAIATFPEFGCGPSPSGNRMRIVELTGASGRVRVDGQLGILGLHVLESDRCDPLTGCVAGGGTALYFDASPGKRYVVAVEEGGPNEQVRAQTTCNITSEGRCQDGLDDDADGKSDCADTDCHGREGCPVPITQETGRCTNLVDDDSDGATDCADPDCGDDRACLETCEVLTSSTYCNYKQGLSNGGGKARSTHYACNPVPQTAKEVVFEITAGFSGRIRIGFQSAAGLALHLLVETGRGCTPRDCVAMSTGDLYIDLVEGTTYYLAVDGPGATVGAFDFEIDCEP